MGDFRIVIEAAGGHGCQRELGVGDRVWGCQQMSCPDCMARQFVEQLQNKGVIIHKAELTHWPRDFKTRDGQAPYKDGQQVVDDLLSGIRQDDFPGKKG